MPWADSLQPLSHAECLDLLRTAKVGRIGVSVDALPAIFPVFVRLIGDSIVVRTVPGTKLRAAGSGAIVAVEIDQVDETTGEGWSVLVRGVAQELIDGPALEMAHTEFETPWPEDARELVVAVDTHMVTGRRLGAPTS